MCLLRRQPRDEEERGREEGRTCTEILRCSAQPESLVKLEAKHEDNVCGGEM